MWLSIFLFVMFIAHSYSGKVIKYEKQTLVLLSFDGFRYDYVKRENLKHFQELTKHGVTAKSLQPTFVTKTFPNHFTLVTGLYEESHGIVSNYMYDPVYREYFDPEKSSFDPKWWNAATPIWIENELQFMKNKTRTRKSATIYWPGSYVSYDNHWPYYRMKKYNASYTTKQRFDKVVDLLLEPDPVNFIACYFEEPDNTSHLHGPDHIMTSKVLKELDKQMGYFIEKMKRANLYEKVNIIVVSDHGMSTVHPKNVITLTDYLNKTDYVLVNYGTFLLINPKLGLKEKVYNHLKKIKHLSTYYKKDIPDKWHYKHNRRITEIFAITDEGYYIAPDKEKQKEKSSVISGDHGYDNNIMNMHGIFLAHGPAFKSNYKVGTVKSIDICSLMCHILDLKKHPNNGFLQRIKHIVIEKTLFTVIMKQPAFIITLLSLCGIFVLVIILGCVVSCLRNLMESAKYKQLYEDLPLTTWTEDEDITEFSRK